MPVKSIIEIESRITDHGSRSTLVGVLALQGNFAEHRALLDQMNVKNVEVRSTSDLASVSALIIPGGESTVMMRLLQESGLDQEIIRRAKGGTLPILGTCAGAIVLSDSHLNLMHISVDRNAYGSQLESFDTTIELDGKMIEVAFIRAPKITGVGRHVEVLSEHDGVPVLVREGQHIATACHPEMRKEEAIHRIFLSGLNT